MIILKNLTTERLWTLNHVLVDPENFLLISASNNKYSSSAKLANTFNKRHPDLNVSRRTVLNVLHDLQYRCTVPKAVPLLTDKHKERWLQNKANKIGIRLFFRYKCLEYSESVL